MRGHIDDLKEGKIALIRVLFTVVNLLPVPLLLQVTGLVATIVNTTPNIVA